MSEILRVEIPNDAKNCIDKGYKAATKPVVVLILCQDSRTCYQLNQYLTQGAEKYLLFTAMKNDVPIKKLSKVYKNVRESDVHSIRLRGSDIQNETIQVRTVLTSFHFSPYEIFFFLQFNSQKMILVLQSENQQQYLNLQKATNHQTNRIVAKT